MKKIVFVLALPLLLLACKDSEEKLVAINDTIETSKTEAPANRTLSEEFKAYWYNGTAEITSYKLSQERYGELREGTAVNIFVTEDFLPNEQVKADRQATTNIPVLKLNNTKKFLTGIYPYSIMTSAFSPVSEKGHALKISHSMQEWCGHVYIQLNNRDDFELLSHSYFEGEADQSFSLPKTWLENELWNLIRINPDELPTGDIAMIPSLEYTRMRHKGLAAQEATATLTQNEGTSIYKLRYPQLQRELTIFFNSEAPFTIEGWEESGRNGLITTATKLKQIRSPYWGKNGNKDLVLRDSLGL